MDKIEVKHTDKLSDWLDIEAKKQLGINYKYNQSYQKFKKDIFYKLKNIVGENDYIPEGADPDDINNLYKQGRNSLRKEILEKW